MELINGLLEIPLLDPEEARRRKLLNILLLGVEALTFLTLGAALIGALLHITGGAEETLLLFVSTGAMLVGTIIIYLINRYWSGMVAASLFLLLLTVVLALSDTAEQVVIGRTLFLFTIPIIMASVLLRPYASFILAGIVSLLVAGVSLYIGIVPAASTPMGFFAIALVSWLATRSLEQALGDLREINRELDQLVAERTQELSEALKREQAESSKNQAILKSIADGVIVFDKEGKAFTANPAIARLLGMPSAQIVGSGFKKIIDDSVAEADREMLTQLLNSTEPHDQNIKVNWGEKVFSISLAPVVDNSGTVSGTVVVLRDFTAEAELDRMKSAFVSMASHELRTPLNAILGYSDMLEQGIYGPLSDEQKKIQGRVKANVNRMLNLVNNLLDTARIEAGKLKVNLKPFDIRELLDDIHSFMKVLAEQRGLGLTVSVSDKLPQSLNSDAERLRQIIVNLIGNALKFTKEGTVVVSAFCQDDTHWALTVTDTGVGIPEQEQEGIFDPFTQVDDPITRRQGGSGLGLSIVKQLSELLGGSIQLKSTVGTGSTFTVTLPLTHLETPKTQP